MSKNLELVVENTNMFPVDTAVNMTMEFPSKLMMIFDITMMVLVFLEAVAAVVGIMGIAEMAVNINWIQNGAEIHLERMLNLNHFVIDLRC